MTPEKRAAIDDAHEACLAARERVALLTALANRKTADPGRVMADLEKAIEQEKRAQGALEAAHRLARSGIAYPQHDEEMHRALCRAIGQDPNEIPF